MESLQAKNILMERGIRPSLHRIKILEYLLNNKNHPSVDAIFNDISADVPTLSKTTIYNTLKLLHKKDVVKILTIEENEVKFDAEMRNHAHFKCLECQELYDLPVKDKTSSLKTIHGHKITENHQYYKGICKNCL